MSVIISNIIDQILDNLLIFYQNIAAQYRILLWWESLGFGLIYSLYCSSIGLIVLTMPQL